LILLGQFGGEGGAGEAGGAGGAGEAGEAGGAGEVNSCYYPLPITHYPFPLRNS